MKRKTRPVLALLLAVCWSMCLLSGCDGVGNYDSVSADSVPRGVTLTLPIQARYNPGGYYAFGSTRFTLPRENWPKVVEQVKSTCGEDAVTEPAIAPTKIHWTGLQCLLICLPEPDGEKQYYLLSRSYFDSKEDLYLFFNMGGRLLDGGDMTQAQTLLLPFQYICDARLLHDIDPDLYLGAEYELTLLKEDPQDDVDLIQQRFLDFYEGTAYSAQPIPQGLLLQLDQQRWQLQFRIHSGAPFFTVEELPPS